MWKLVLPSEVPMQRRSRVGRQLGEDDEFNLCRVTFGMPMEHAAKMFRQQLGT